MSGCRFGECMILKGIRVERPSAREPPEPASELRTPALEVVRAQLIDGEEDDQRRRARRIRQWTRRSLRRAALRGERHRAEQCGTDDEESAEASYASKLARAIAHVTFM